MQYLGVISRQNDLGFFQGKPFNITVIWIYAPNTKAKEAEVEGSVKTYKTFQN